MNTPFDSGERQVTLDRTRTMRMDLFALALAEEKTGRNFMSGTGWTALNAQDFATLIWACLVHEDADLTIEQTKKLVMGGHAGQAVKNALYSLYLGEDVVTLKDKKKDESDAASTPAPDRPTPSDGESAGPSLASTSTSPTASSGA